MNEQWSYFSDTERVLGIVRFFNGKLSEESNVIPEYQKNLLTERKKRVRMLSET